MSIQSSETMQNTDPTDLASSAQRLKLSDHLLKIPITVDIVLGSTTMSVAALMQLGIGGVVMLDRKVGEPVDLVVNGRLVARGEVVVIESGARLGISLTEVLGADLN